MTDRVHIERRRTPAVTNDAEARAVWDALLAPLPTVNSKYFYDDRGSELFERITRLDEYYQTRTELALLESLAEEIVDTSSAHELVELGSGAGRKIHLLLDAMHRRGLLHGCVMLDINATFLRSSCERLAADYPEILVRGVVGDFTRDLDDLGNGERRLLVFFAGTIGNLAPEARREFLRRVGRAMGPDDHLLVGLDLVKDRRRLERAYNDADGVTAAFNRNALAVLNTRFGTDFDVEAFDHVAFWDADHEWIEMRLRASRPMRITLPGDPRPLVLETGDEIRTELSCKFTADSFDRSLDGNGLALRHWWTDPDDLFALAMVGRADTGAADHDTTGEPSA
jgi:L-histidine N-alpha-methyltransferase